MYAVSKGMAQQRYHQRKALGAAHPVVLVLFTATAQCVCVCVCSRYLSRLLLLHGRWSYLRNLEVVLYSFYKNWAYVLVYVYLQFVAGKW